MDTGLPSQQEPLPTDSIMTPLTPQQFYQGDPWLVFVKDALHLDTLWNMVIFFVISVTFNFTYTTFGRKDLSPTTSLRDALDLLLLSVAFTSFYLIYLLLPTFMADTFRSLQANGVIGESRQHSSPSLSYERFVQHLLAWSNSRWWLAVIVPIVVLFWLQHPRLPNFWIIPSLLIGVFPGIYIVCFILVRVVLLLVFINRLFFLFAIHVKPLHADGSGGLGSLSHIMWISVGVMSALALAILAIPQRLSLPEIIILTTSYLVLIVSLLIGWLALPHQRLLQARTELLQPITDEYEQAVKETLPSITGETATIVAGTERLSALQARYTLLRDSFPVWPLEIMQMRRLGVALLVPALLALLPSLLDLFTKK